MKLLSVALVVLAGTSQAQHTRNAPGELSREKALLLAPPGAMIPEHGALGPFADLDGDGDVDFLSDAGLNLDNGYGRFQEARVPALSAEPRLGLFDANADAALDLLTRTHLYLGDGAGGFADASANLPAGFVADVAVLVDLDQDLDADIFALRNESSSVEVRVALNDGTGIFVDASAGLPPAPGSRCSLAAGDVDGDGDLDLVLGSGADEVWLNDGAAHFTVLPGALPVDDELTLAVAPVDVDGDGGLDLALGNDSMGGAVLLLNDGHGAFSFGQELTGLDTTAAILVLDREGDGDPDLVLLTPTRYEGVNVFGTIYYYPYDSRNHLLVNDGAGGFTGTGALHDTAGACRAGFAGDVDGDGDPDLILVDPLHRNQILLNDGLGAFESASAPTFVLDPNEHGARALALGDLNGDGLADVLTGKELLFGSAAGRLTPSGVVLPLLPWHCLDTVLMWRQTGGIALGDVDGDGDLDAYVLGPECAASIPPVNQDNRLWINDGAGAFSDQTAARLPQGDEEIWGAPSLVALVELDGDGDLDAVCLKVEGGLGGGPNCSYVNDGGGVFARVQTFWDPSRCGALGDLDGDGDADLLMGAYQHGGRNRVYDNDGSAHFTLAPSALPTHALPDDAYAAVLGDIDGDGDLDAYVSCSGAPPSFVYVNDGSGTFVDEPQRLPESLAGSGRTNQVSFTDLDLDGDGDFLSPQRLFLNDGAGFFADGAARTRPRAMAVAQVVGDVDLDGDPDVVSMDSVQIGMTAGFARELEAFGPPRIGKRLTLAVHGSPRTPYALLESTRAFRAPLGAMGWLLVDPSRLVLLVNGVLDGRGEAPYRRMLPASAALIGSTSYWQAFVGKPSHGTNLLITTVTGL